MTTPDGLPPRRGEQGERGEATNPTRTVTAPSPRSRVRRRQAASFFIIVAVVIGIGVLAAAVNQGVVTLPFASRTPCPSQPPDPAEPQDTSVRVLNASDRRGIAGSTAEELTGRGYHIVTVGNAEGDRDFPDPAQIRHGPDGVSAARAVQAQVPGAVLVQDTRADAQVDLVLGAGFQSLATPEDAQAALAPAPVPTDCEPVTSS